MLDLFIEFIDITQALDVCIILIV